MRAELRVSLVKIWLFSAQKVILRDSITWVGGRCAVMKHFAFSAILWLSESSNRLGIISSAPSPQLSVGPAEAVMSALVL